MLQGPEASGPAEKLAGSLHSSMIIRHLERFQWACPAGLFVTMLNLRSRGVNEGCG